MYQLDLCLNEMASLDVVGLTPEHELPEFVIDRHIIPGSFPRRIKDLKQRIADDAAMPPPEFVPVI
jgi:hypothetical protein